MLKDVLIQALVVLGGRYFDGISQILKLIFKILKHHNVVAEAPRFLSSPSVDERIAKLDETRANLLESLKIVDDLQRDAVTSKQQLEEALSQLQIARTEHYTTKQEVEYLRQIAKSDINSFRKMAGVPNMRIERTIGFVGGIGASLAASALWYFCAKFFD